jgi:hypothetical protein
VVDPPCAESEHGVAWSLTNKLNTRGASVTPESCKKQSSSPAARWPAASDRDLCRRLR